MTAEITFAIPFYRDTNLLRIAVDSVLAQRNSSWQLFVCDDSGLDLSLEKLLQAYGDPRIGYLENSGNLGMVETWNRCLDHSQSDLVTLLHADDALTPGYVDLMLSLANKHQDASAFFCQTEIVNYDGSKVFSMADAVKGFLIPGSSGDELVLHGEDAVASLMAGYFIMTPTLCYRKSRIADRRFDPAFKQVQDLVFVVGLLMDGHTLVGSPERGYAYRRHPGSATTRQSESMLRFDEEVLVFNRIADRARELGWVRAEKVSSRKRIIKLHLLYRTLRAILQLRPSTAIEALRYWSKIG
ncbi:MAG: glycosyltransferase family 2 protein [Myxococcales bacterium]|nr:glycosyltransferase family 2 protein [Myxococcales bacterium]